MRLATRYISRSYRYLEDWVTNVVSNHIRCQWLDCWPYQLHRRRRLAYFCLSPAITLFLGWSKSSTRRLTCGRHFSHRVHAETWWPMSTLEWSGKPQHNMCTTVSNILILSASLIRFLAADCTRRWMVRTAVSPVRFTSAARSSSSEASPRLEEKLTSVSKNLVKVLRGGGGGGKNPFINKRKGIH